jgi:hypothetical protein
LVPATTPIRVRPIRLRPSVVGTSREQSCPCRSGQHVCSNFGGSCGCDDSARSLDERRPPKRITSRIFGDLRGSVFDVAIRSWACGILQTPRGLPLRRHWHLDPAGLRASTTCASATAAAAAASDGESTARPVASLAGGVGSIDTCCTCQTAAYSNRSNAAGHGHRRRGSTMRSTCSGCRHVWRQRTPSCGEREQSCPSDRLAETVTQFRAAPSS